jgi:YesN/AraC family two-component response regulator
MAPEMETASAPRPVVLVIDDDDGLHEALRLVLEDDYEVLSAFDGDEGLDILGRRHVDLVLLDLLMPRIDGWHAFEEIRALRAWPPRVIFLTGIDHSAAAVAALKLGADDWIIKPFEEPALLMQLRSLLPARRPIILTGGHPGTRASVAVVLHTRCGLPVDYGPPPANSHALTVPPGHDEADLVAVLSQSPIGLTELSRPTRTVLHRVSRRYADASVEGLAGDLGLSRGHVSERFRQEVGLPLVDYIARVRVEVIKQRLAMPGRPPLERLAEEVGLCHASHLSRVFAKYVGMSPGQYRTNMQRQP